MPKTDLKQNTEINPRLVAIAGPLQGAVFTLTEPECSIGRDPSNRICLMDISVSRRHCHIFHEADQFILRDLESLNCTFVNYTSVVSAGDNLLFYRASDGAALVGHIDRNGAFQTTQLSNTATTGWTQIIATRK